MLIKRTTRVLSDGSSPVPYVKRLQAYLRKYGVYLDRIDGVFGPKLETAVKHFQASNGLQADGVVGISTWAKLFSLYTFPKSLEVPFFDSIKDSLFKKLSQSQVDGINFKAQVFTEKGLSIQYAAYMLATSYHETAATMQPVVERGSDSYLAKYDTGKLAKTLGNTPAADKDGQRYKGRGDVQLTGLTNYIKAGKAVGLDLASNPEKALDPHISAEIMVAGMVEGWFTSRKLSMYINTQGLVDYTNARRIINGTDKAAQIAEYALKFEIALLGVPYD